MTSVLPERVQEFLRNQQDLAIIRHMHSMCAEQGKSVDEVIEVSIQALMYKGPPDGHRKTYEPVGIGFYTLTFADKTSHRQYWRLSTNEPITYMDAKALINTDRLIASDRAFLESGPDALREHKRLQG